MSAASDAASPRTPPAAGRPAAMWRGALPWLLAYGALHAVLSLVQLPRTIPPAVILVVALLQALAVLFLSCAALAAVVRGLLRREGDAPRSPFADRAAWAGIGQLALAGLAFWLLNLTLFRWMPEVGTTLPGPLIVVLLSAGDVGLICFAAAIGCAVALLIRDRNILLPAGVFAAFADYFMVRWGTVHHAMQSEGGAKVVQAMSASVPSLHVSLPRVTMGMADFVFLTFFFACAWRFSMNLRATFFWLAFLLALLLWGIRWLGAFPAVAPMALGFVLVNLRYFRLSRAEIQATALVFCLMAALTAAFFLLR